MAPEPVPVPDRLIRECSVDDLIDEIVSRCSVVAFYAMRYYHFTGKDGEPGKGEFHQWNRLHGHLPMLLGGIEVLKQRAVAQVHEKERGDLAIPDDEEDAEDASPPSTVT